MFGEYLIEKKLVRPKELVRAVVMQHKKTPGLLEIVYAKKLLDEPHLLQALAYQARNGTDFKQSCVALGFWTDAIEETVHLEINTHRVPVGQILVKNGDLSMETAASALSDYFRSSPEKNYASILLRSDQTLEKKTDVSAVIREEPRELPEEAVFEPNFHRVDGQLLQDYLDLLCEDKKNELEKILVDIETGSKGGVREASTETLLKALFRDLHTIKGTARFIRAEVSEHLVHVCEDYLSLYICFFEKMEDKDFESLTSLFLNALDFVWDIRKPLMENGSEEVYWQQHEAGCRSFLVSLRTAQKEIRDRNYEVNLADLEHLF